MTPQVGLTVVCPLLPERADAVRALLDEMGQRPADNDVLPFGHVPGVHFARLVLLDAAADATGAPLPAQLLLMADLDGTEEAGLAALVEAAGAGLDRLLAHCDGCPAQPDASSRLAFLRARAVRSDAFYANTIGRTVTQVRDEARLRDAIEGFLDGCGDWAAKDPVQVRRDVQTFVAGRDDLRFALDPVVERDGGWVWSQVVALGVVPVVVLVIALLLLPLTVLALIVFVVVLRLHETSDAVSHDRPTAAHERELAALEDRGPQNQFSAVGLVKPGWFRLFTAWLVLFLTNYGTHHVFFHASLAGVKTIHFARWVALDARRRMIFCSSYDGSLESYMDDFIDKVSWGLNATFSNGLGFPRTDFLLFRGSRDELAFKDFLRVHQVPTQVWYSAYDQLTCLNVENNARIRAGLHGPMDETAAAGWLAQL